MNNAKPALTLLESNRSALIEDFRSFVAAPSFPCVGAKSALTRQRLEFEVCDSLGSSASADVLRESLARFSERHPDPGMDPVSFVAIFRDQVTGEDDFHKRLWMQLQAIHDLDVAEHPWAPDVSDDPGSSDFSFSVASRAFFVQLTPHLKNQWVERRYRAANPMIFLPPRGALGRAPVLRTPQGERK